MKRMQFVKLDFLSAENIEKTDDNMQIRFGVGSDENASIVPLRYLFLHFWVLLNVGA